MKNKFKKIWDKLFNTNKSTDEALKEEVEESLDISVAPAIPNVDTHKDVLVTLDKIPPELVLFYKLNLHELSKSLTFSEEANQYMMDYIKDNGYEIKYLECVTIKGAPYVIAASKQPQNIKVMLLLYSLYSFIKGGSEEILQYLVHTQLVDKQKIFIFKD